MDKDLYSLIGGTPPIAFSKPTHLSKWNTKKPAEPWVCKPFLHPARGDSLVLNHWVKASEQDSDDYHFAKFNRVVDIIEYTDEEYDKYLTDTDWSKEETNYLFKLCQQYDLRFPVIADRFEYGTSARTMEDLKDRYYSVNRKLIKVRGGLTHEYNPHVDRQTLLQQYSYDKTKEIERKQALLKLYQRTKEEIEEEEILFLEAKRMEEYQQVLTTQRDQLYSTLHLEQAQQIPSTPLTPIHTTSAAAVAAAGHISPTAGAASSSSLSGSTGSVNLSSHVSSSSTASLSHLKSPTSSTASHSNPGGISIAGGTSGSQDQKKKKKDESVKKARRISTSSSMEDLLPPPPERKDKLIPGVIVRSQKLPGVKATMQAKVLRAMADFGIGPRPIMPTQEVCYKYEHLQNSVLYLLETKKSAEKLNIDTKNIGRKHSLSGSSNSNRPNGDRRRKIG
ncbi:hypothetical protein BJ944DRAFT_290272 [Cunninghamella echinulata]|nr:hypothetical protein BJ944DRAFT_290272 [Cunninghamella echinulata]